MPTYRMTALAAAAVILAEIGTGCSPAPAHPQTFVDQEKGFSITFPGDWRKTIGGFSGTDLVLIPPDELATSGARDNLTVHVEDLSPTMSLDAFFAAKAAAAARADPDLEYREFAKGPATVAGHDARQLMYSMLMNETRVTTVAYFFVSGQRGYTILETAASDRFPERKPAFDAMAASLKFE